MAPSITLDPYSVGLLDVTPAGGTTLGEARHRTITTVVSDRSTRDNGPDAVPRPPDLVNGDDLYIFVGLGYQGGQDTVSGPAGFTQLISPGAGDSAQLSLWYHHVSNVASEPASYSFTWQGAGGAGTGIASAVIICVPWYGITPPPNVLNPTGHTLAATTHSTPGGTSTVDSYVISAWAMNCHNNSGQANGAIQAPAGTELIYFNQRQAVNSISVLLAGERVQTPGPLASRTVSSGTFSCSDAVVTLALPVTPVSVNRGLQRGTARGVLRGIQRGTV